MKDKQRCPWAYGSSPLYIPYHDEEWGRPVRDDRTQFEFLTLELHHQSSRLLRATSRGNMVNTAFDLF